MRRGEVWLFESPDDKNRPVVVLTRDEAIDALNRVLVAPCTRKVREIPTHIKLDESDGMLVPCAVSLDNIFAARKGLLTRRITALGPDRMASVCGALNTAVSC